MDQSAADVPEKTQKPENEDNYKYGPQHKFYSGLIPREIMSNRAARRSKTKSGVEFQEAKAPACLILFIKCMSFFSLNVSQALDFLSEFFLGFAESRLEPAQKFLILPFSKRKVVVS
jgi:hypothetical protein